MKGGDFKVLAFRVGRFHLRKSKMSGSTKKKPKSWDEIR
jgi:hypothetical protein